jgi:hypothetical protein
VHEQENSGIKQEVQHDVAVVCQISVCQMSDAYGLPVAGQGLLCTRMLYRLCSPAASSKGMPAVQWNGILQLCSLSHAAVSYTGFLTSVLPAACPSPAAVALAGCSLAAGPGKPVGCTPPASR